MGCEEVKKDKNNSPKRDMDIINKNLNTNGNYSNNTGIIIKDKKIEEFENIKSISKYVLKNMIFPFLPEKQKLEIIIYNKELQNKLDINIEDYKKIKGIYRIGERNGKGKEYYSSGFLRFEGEYLNGKKNGKGKEYHDGELIFKGEYSKETVQEWKLIFKGEYKNGKRNGKGKEYKNGVLQFEGEYLNGERNGKGKKYYWDGKLEFEGEYLNGKRWNGKGYNKEGKIDYEIKEGNGKVKEYDDYGRLRFEGEYLNGERNGKGKEYYYNGELLFE